ncbi:type VI secretion system baseplate subunit TssE [Shewanella psychropiezotolerans]|uniref:Type VI secretion system baseplate subunit TssE n=1 Tax=Shewanella psychropiezotolerans TaxID=2593655 RepID=A0ABX5WW75_9GAMM|nr:MULTISPECIES: GPW/gp25 family protein [Shewanella]MPY26919.1 type VI secretion system baseplate subunit TssE [Shewanella sp. YLB-07]QDO83355.1 type VI secretion system baseplate subunit TssE [Shewanella psychropiezotolerans]
MSLITKLGQCWSDNLDNIHDDIIDNLCGLISARAPIWLKSEQSDRLSGTIVNMGMTCVSRWQNQSNSDGIVTEMTALIQRYEPRLSQVEIEIQETLTNENRLRFRIFAVMHSAIAEEEVVLDSFLDFNINRLIVRRANLV